MDIHDVKERLGSGWKWGAATYLGVIARVSVIPVLAVAFLGFGMLAGRIDWRTGVRVVVGMFILFGAPMIVRELMALA